MYFRSDDQSIALAARKYLLDAARLDRYHMSSALAAISDALGVSENAELANVATELRIEEQGVPHVVSERGGLDPLELRRGIFRFSCQKAAKPAHFKHSVRLSAATVSHRLIISQCSLLFDDHDTDFWNAKNLDFGPNPSILLYCARDVLWLNVTGEDSFRSPGHHAVAVTSSSRGAEEYLAQGLHSFGERVSIVREGATSAALRSYKRKEIASTFSALVLRFDWQERDRGRWPKSRDGAGHVHWRKLTPKGKIMLEQGRWWRFNGSLSVYYFIVARRSADFVELWRFR